MLSIQGRSHRRLSKFVDWIKPSPDTRETITKQAGEIRDAIKHQAEDDDLSVIATPASGSFAKHTGLRRHIRGDTEIEGQDVDLPFVVKPATTEGERIKDLLTRFERYAKASYPSTTRRVTGSSVQLDFTASKLTYDLVPMLTSNRPDYQIILKKNGTRRLTSVAKHNEFVWKRTAHSDGLPGRVKFNECVRLIKWWRDVRISGGGSIKEVRTILLELLCAHAYDKLGVQPTYTETLFLWFNFLANVTATRVRVAFDDYKNFGPLFESVEGNQYWHVIDPVNVNNNVVHSSWRNIELSEFSRWFETTRDSLNRLVAQEAGGADGEVDNILVELFGSAILTHGTL